MAFDVVEAGKGKTDFTAPVLDPTCGHSELAPL
jgi:hypothetical protein